MKHNLTGYVRDKCRCEVCVKAFKDYNKKYRDREKSTEAYKKRLEAKRGVRKKALVNRQCTYHFDGEQCKNKTGANYYFCPKHFREVRDYNVWG